MDHKGKITLKDNVDNEVFHIGEKYAKGLEPGIKANKEFLESMKALKKLALEYGKIQKEFKGVKGQKQFLAIKKKEIQLSEQTTAALKIQQTTERNLIATIEKKTIATEGTNKALVRERLELQRLNKLEKEEAILKSKTSSVIDKLIVKRSREARVMQDLIAKRELGNKLSKKEQSSLSKSTKAFHKYENAIKTAKVTTKQFQENVGNYPKTMKTGIASLRNLVGAFGAIEGAKMALNIVKEARQLAIDAKGVEFAFQKIEERTGKAEEALLKTKKSTRGLMSDLDIKKAIVELDNFNISAEETDTLMEFLAVRASQTGNSIDKLKDSLVEGLSKESKLRIDNLGISAAELNAELEKTPDFTKAVANIAKREIKEAGSILDDAGSSTERWNANLSNAQLRLGKMVNESGFVSFLTDAASATLELLVPTEKLSESYQKQQVELNVLANKLTDTNIKEDDRKVLIEQLNKQYPFFLKNLDAEKVTNEELGTRLSEVNQLYIKRIALQAQQEKIQEVLNDAAKEATKDAFDQIKVDKEIARINATTLKGSLDLANTSYEQRIKLTKEALEKNAKFSTSVRDGSTVASNEEAKALNKLNRALGQNVSTKVRAKRVNKELTEEQSNLKLLEEKMGSTLAEINAMFSIQSKVIDKTTTSTTDLTDAEKKLAAERRKALAEANHSLKIAQLQEEIDKYKEVAEDEGATLKERIKAQTNYNDAKIELLKINRDYEIASINESSKSKAEGDAKKAVLEIEYQANRKQIALDGNASYLAIIKSGFEEEKKAITEAKDLKDKALKDAIIAENEAFDKTGKSVEDVEAHEKEIADIKKKFALETIEVQIAAVEKLYYSGKFTNEQQEQLSEQLKDLKIAHSNLETDAVIEGHEEQKKSEEELAKAKAKIISDGSAALAEALNIDANNLQNLVTSIVDGFGEGFEGALEGIQATAAVVSDVLGSIYDGNIEKLEGQLDANEEYYARQYELAGTDQRKKDLLKKEEELKRQILLKKIAKEKTKAAKVEKAAAIVQAGINTALAITSALTMAPPAAYVMAALSGAMGIAQIAAIASKPIPKYAKGTDYHPGGHALVGEERAEVITEPGKAPYVVDGPQVLDLAKGTKVTPSIAEYEKLMRASILTSLDIDNQKAKDYQSKTAAFDQNLLLLALKENTQAVREQQTNVNVQAPSIDLEYLAYRNEQLD